MRVRQLVGRYAGKIIEMPFHVAQACLAAGTAAHPDDELRNVRGITVEKEEPAAVEVAAIESAPNRMMTSADVVTRGPKRGRKKA